MARSLRLFLIRHGETVDNVAQLYAGSRDSALTNHGHMQATRLGLHFKALGLVFTHLFSSHLERAVKTAGLIREAQLSPEDDVKPSTEVPEVEQLRVLMEQDFGDLEGKKWKEMQADLQSKPGAIAVETKEELARRADKFLDERLSPLLGNKTDGSDLTIAIVSHGIFLSTLWKRLLRRLPSKSISMCPDLRVTERSSLEHLGGWSNTGYLELSMVQSAADKSALATDAATSPSSKTYVSPPHTAGPGNTSGTVKMPASAIEPRTPAGGDLARHVSSGAKTGYVMPEAAPAMPTASHSSEPCIAHGWTTTILTINGQDHLKGLKRTRGGVGSSRHDASQKSIESFFKRRKLDRWSQM